MGLIILKVISTIFLLFWVMSGCGTLDVKEVESGESVIVEKQKALVFGKIFLVEDDEVKLPYGLTTPHLNILNIESGKTKKMLYVEKDGSFYWALPRGSYVITNVAMECYYSIQPQVKFDVPLEGDVFYLGTLKLDIEEKSFPHRIIIKSIKILDEFDAAKKVIVNRNPDFIFTIQKSLIIIIPDKSPITNIFPCVWQFFIPPLGTFR